MQPQIIKPKKKHIRAVQKTIKMWEWLRDNPDMEKFDYFNKFRLSQRFANHLCYLCYYWWGTKMLGNLPLCPDCPLYNDKGGCNNAFLEWVHTDATRKNYATRRRNAQIIVDLCKEWLKEREL